MKKIRLNIEFLDGTTDSDVGVDIELGEGMLILDYGQTAGQAGYNVRAIKSWYTEPVVG